jgi:hypothetical protein
MDLRRRRPGTCDRHVGTCFPLAIITATLRRTRPTTAMLDPQTTHRHSHPTTTTFPVLHRTRFGAVAAEVVVDAVDQMVSVGLAVDQMASGVTEVEGVEVEVSRYCNALVRHRHHHLLLTQATSQESCCSTDPNDRITIRNRLSSII